MTDSEFEFDSIIYNGFDDQADGIGNHLSLFDRNLFENIPPGNKSLSPIPVRRSPHVYGRVEADLHLAHPDRFRNCLFLDVARETWEPDIIRQQMEKTVQHKRVFNAVTAVYLMWESDRLWDQYADMIAVYDFCIVTSSILDDFLRRRGIDFVKLPHPYDFHINPPTHERVRGDGPVRFGVSAGLWRRKNVSLLAESFAETFGDDSDVSLHIHTRSDVTHRDYREEYERIARQRARCQGIVIESGAWSRPAYLNWLRSLDAYCFVSAGEGYSVTPREALHLGIPVILHDAHVHREFSHLPGVVRVASAGLQAARANTSDYAHDIGHEWRVDHDALKDALRYTHRHLPDLSRALSERHDEVMSLHDLAAVKAQWVGVLNDRYAAHKARIRTRIRGVREYPLSAVPLMDVDLSSPGFRCGTGRLVDGMLFCIKREHPAGHGLYGPYLPVAVACRAQVMVDLVMLSAAPPEYIGTIDVYDSAGGRVLAMEHVLNGAFVDGRTRITVDARFDAGQIIEFRLFWNGDSDVCVTDLKVVRVDDIVPDANRRGEEAR